MALRDLSVGEPPHSSSESSRPIPLWTPTEEQWQQYKPHILHLYRNCKQDLSSVIEEMKRKFGFKATIDQYKGHIHRKWKVSGKYHTEDEWRAMAIITALRARSGQESHFRLRGKYVHPRDVLRYWRRKQISIAQAAATTSWVPYPEGLECLPASSVHTCPNAPQDFSDAERIFWHMRKLASSWEEFEYSPDETAQFVISLWRNLLHHEDEKALKQTVASRCAAMATRSDCILWILGFMMRFDDSELKVRIINGVVDPMVRTNTAINGSARTIVQSLAHLPVTTMHSIASISIGVALQALTEIHSPTHANILGLAIIYAFTTRDWYKLRRIVEGFTAYLSSENALATTFHLLRLFEGWCLLGDSRKVHQLGIQLLRPEYYHELSFRSRVFIFRGIWCTSRDILDQYHSSAERPTLIHLICRLCYEYEILRAERAWCPIVKADQIHFDVQHLKIPSLRRSNPDQTEFDYDLNVLREAWLAMEDKQRDEHGFLQLSQESRRRFDELKRWAQDDNHEAAVKFPLATL